MAVDLARALLSVLLAVAFAMLNQHRVHAQGISAQGGMYYAYGSSVGPLYGCAEPLDDTVVTVSRASSSSSSSSSSLPSRSPRRPSSPRPHPPRSRRRSSGPVGVINPLFGTVGVLGTVPTVGFGGDARFFPAAARVGGGGGGFVGRGGVRGGAGFGFARGRGFAGRRKLSAKKTETDDPSTRCETMWELLRARDDASVLTTLLLRTLPEAVATLDAKNASNASAPLRDANGEHFRDTFFAPSDDAFVALLAYVNATKGGVAGEPMDADDVVDRLLGGADADADADAANANATRDVSVLVAYHVVPNVEIASVKTDVKRGDLLRTALGSEWRLMVDAAAGADDADDAADADAAFVVRGIGSQAGAVTTMRACNGVIHVVDRVLLPTDVDGAMTARQREHVSKIEATMEEEAREGA